MSYLTPEEFKRRYFAESKHPSLSTLRRQLESGELKGRKLGRQWFVDIAAFEACGNPILEQVFRNVSRTA